MSKRKKITILTLITLISFTGCSKEVEPVEVETKKESVEVKTTSDIILKYEKAFGDLDFSELPNGKGILNVDTSKEMLGDEYQTFISAYSLETSEENITNNVVIAEHSIHIEDKFKEDDLSLQAIYNLLNVQSNTIFKDLDYKEFVEYLNKTLGNQEFLVTKTDKEFIRLIRRNSKVTLTVCNVDSSETKSKKYKMKNYKYDEFLDLMYYGNSDLINELFTRLNVSMQIPNSTSKDPTVVGYTPSFVLPSGQVIEIGIVDGQNAENMRTFDINFRVKIRGNVNTKVDTVLETTVDFLNEKFGVSLEPTRMILDAKSYQILNNFISELEEKDELMAILNPSKRNDKVIDYNPYEVDTNIIMSNDNFEMDMIFPITVDGKRTK